jgi:transcriptional regulator with XRE-family HTH domain
MGAISEALRHDLSQPEFSEGYAESFQDALVATQIKVLREDNRWTQADLAEKIGTTQTAISRIESVNYSAWNISTLKKLARAFRVRLKVSFETYGSLIQDVEGFSRESLRRIPREEDPELSAGSDAGVPLAPSHDNADVGKATPEAAALSNLLVFPSGIRPSEAPASPTLSGNQTTTGAAMYVMPTAGNNFSGSAGGRMPPQSQPFSPSADPVWK